MGASFSREQFEERLELLRKRLPSLERSSVNDRTVYVWRRHWMDKFTLREIAGEQGWSEPAVRWHLRRAGRVLKMS